MSINRQLLEQPFSPKQIKQRAGSFGKSLDYIEGHAVIQRLNDAFESNWSFEIISHEIMENEVMPYLEWDYLEMNTEPSFNNLNMGVGGALYPPNLLPCIVLASPSEQPPRPRSA